MGTMCQSWVSCNFRCQGRRLFFRFFFNRQMGRKQHSQLSDHSCSSCREVAVWPHPHPPNTKHRLPETDVCDVTSALPHLPTREGRLVPRPTLEGPLRAHAASTAAPGRPSHTRGSLQSGPLNAPTLHTHVRLRYPLRPTF